MALQSKTINGSTGNSNWSWKMEVIENSTDTANNTSSVTVNSYMGRPNSASYFGGYGDVSINCNGEVRSHNKTFSYPTNVSAGGWVLMQSETFTVKHNDNGTKDINVSSSLANANFSPGSASASGSMTLTKIPRYFTSTPSVSLTSKTETSATFSWSTSENASVSQYKINDGNWVNVEMNINKKSGTITINGLSANTKYTIYFDFMRKDSGLWCETKPSLSVTTYDYPYCTEAPNFTIGNKVTIKFYNPLNRQIQIRMWSHTSKDFVSDLITTSGTSYTGFDNVSSRLYASIPNNSDSRYNIDVHYGNNKAVKEGGTYSINANNCIPSVGNITYKDTNENTIAITGDNQRIIRNHSKLLFSVTSATAKNSASISKYEVTFGGVTKSRTNVGDLDFGTINLAQSTNATLKVTDSRGISNTKQINVVIDNWELPTALIELKRKNNYYSETYFKVDGSSSYLNGKNELNIKYQYKKINDTNYSDLIEIEDNKQVTIDLDNNYQWNLKAILSDKLGTTTYNVMLERGMPITYFDRVKNSVGINCFPKYDENVELNGETLKGSIVASSAEPEKGEKVWLQIGENLYNPKNAYKYSGALQNIYFEYHNVKVGETYVFKTGRNWTTIYTYNSAKERVRILGDTMYNYEQSVTIQDGETYFIAFFYAGADTDISTYDFTGIVLEKGKKIMTNKIYTKTYDRYEECCFDSSDIVYGKEKLSDILDNYKRGATREGTVVNSYVRLFTFDMTGIWKNTSILFYLNDTQNNTFSQLVDMSVKKNGENDELSLHTFKALNFMGSVTSQLVGVVTSKNKIEVYFKMGASQSPNISILSMAKLNENTAFGVITIDCKTVVSSLPSGTQKYVSNMF